MDKRELLRTTGRWAAVGVGFVIVSYVSYVGVTWLRYGNATPAVGRETDDLLNSFMPNYDVVDRHSEDIAAPPEKTVLAATQLNLESSSAVRGIFRAREWILRSQPPNTIPPLGLLEEMKSLGWGLLAERPGQEIVMGSVTKPWEANPVFRALPPTQFAAFQDPGYIKIVWTLRADPVGANASIFRTETRAVATDPVARRKFRRYWSFLSPGIIAIRSAMLPILKVKAEHPG